MPARTAFSTAFVATLVAAALANALPYLLTRRAYQRDGQEVAGFPLSFRKLGGDCGVSACDSYGFHAVHFAVDLGLALACAALAGYIASRWGRRKAPGGTRMATTVKTGNILRWSAAIAVSLALGVVLLLRDSGALRIVPEPVCVTLPSNLHKLGPALPPKEIARVRADAQWEALKTGMRPGDTVHEFETRRTGGVLMLRGGCVLGQAVDWIR